jgi:MDMPI C-terminal domain
LTAALEAAVRTKTPLIAPAKAAQDLRLVATDVDWSYGPDSAAEVRGPAESLLLALCGRPAGLDDLQGDGVAELKARISR